MSTTQQQTATTSPPDPLQLGGRQLGSRMLIGSSRYPSPQKLIEAIEAAGAEVLTVSVRRMNLRQAQDTFLADERLQHMTLLPNTSGCYTAKDAVLSAELAREALGTNWVKVEVIGDEYTLMPDPVELLSACEQLVEKGFVVLPYANDDPVLCQRLEQIGCAAVMPLAAPIGSGLGIRNPHNLELIRRGVRVPVIVDAGIGTASDAALAMELGCDAILLNTAIAEAKDPVRMARAMRWAIQAGREAYLAGRIPKTTHGRASSPLEGLIGD
jgi:thiazole synthase